MNPTNRKKQILEELQQVDNQLSPENLHCDGEISRAQARLKSSYLTAKKIRLEQELANLR